MTTVAQAPSVKDLSDLQDEIITKRREYDVAKAAYTEVEDALAALESKMVTFMSDAGLTTFKTSLGQITLNRRWRVNVPKGDDLDKFMDYLKVHQPESFRHLQTVNYQSLNSWFNAELDAARDRGDVGWAPPGLAEPRVNEYLSIRKG